MQITDKCYLFPSDRQSWEHILMCKFNRLPYNCTVVKLHKQKDFHSISFLQQPKSPSLIGLLILET